MDWLGVVIPVLMVLGALYAAVAAVRRQVRLQRAWASGLTAEGVCLRTWTTVTSSDKGGSTTTHHHVYEFLPRGAMKPVRFEEEDGPATVVEGDHVTVYYPADRPDQATAVQRGIRHLLGTVGTLVFLLVFIVFAGWFAYSWMTFP
ncbi:DUF3592 domain-containing protein [Streptomyces odontomachi]|uniref:DUF3592 domain-containing protein n=1 Tax=Streptomyces odontomachi TaxID=2944940 RepID=UPI00210D885E|nr:DUF3592 domain-containing protein [Streptomyces sp. ODS25]